MSGEADSTRLAWPDLERLTCAAPGFYRSEILIGRGAAQDCLRQWKSAESQPFALLDARAVGGEGAVAPHRGASDASGPSAPARAVLGFLDGVPPERVLRLPGGEDCKRFPTLARVLGAMESAGVDRGGRLIVVGGGAVGDLGGLAASLWLRGIECWQVPTTLLSMVDSSVGGKTAINTETAKNQIGTFWPASRVFIDPGFLSSLPPEQLRSGLGEVLKIAIGFDAELFDYCEQNSDALMAADPSTIATAVSHCVRNKIAIVEQDLDERGPRRRLNLGHTLGHALEADSGFRILHGDAVACGLLHALRVAVRERRMSESEAERCRSLVARFPFPAHTIGRERAATLVRRDKKTSGDTLRAVLPTGIGRCKTVEMPISDFTAPCGSGA